MFKEILDKLPNDGVQIIGVTGQAGVGKSTVTERLKLAAAGFSRPVRELPLDAFFILSSRDRRAWLDEVKLTDAVEYAHRSNQINWWCFEKLIDTLATLKTGKIVALRGIYNREDGGNLTGNISIQPEPNTIIVLEGVAIAHLKQYLDLLLYLHAPAEIRRHRLEARDTHRKGQEAEERFELTQQFEVPYFMRYWSMIDMFIDNGNEHLAPLSELSPTAALGPSYIIDGIAA